MPHKSRAPQSLLASLFVIILTAGCLAPARSRAPQGEPITYVEDVELALPASAEVQGQGCPPGPPAYKPTSPQEKERDDILSLLAYSIVYKNWQQRADCTKECTSECPTPPRGYNIGSVLVQLDSPKTPKILCWGLNSVYRTKNKTQHGELRVLSSYLNGRGSFSRSKAVLYTTLEPCAMCSGTMTMTSVWATIYGEKDPAFGDAIERLVLDSTGLGKAGFCPYPRGVISARTLGPISQTLAERLDTGYQEYRKACEDKHDYLVDWLKSTGAKQIYAAAAAALAGYRVQFKDNQPLLKDAREFLGRVPTKDGGYLPVPYTAACPPP